MSTISPSNLMKMNEKEMMKLRKEDIVKCLTSYRYSFEANEKSVKEANDKLVSQKTNESAAKQLLAAYTETKIPDDGYSSKGIDELDLLHLTGKALLKASRY